MSLTDVMVLFLVDWTLGVGIDLFLERKNRIGD